RRDVGLGLAVSPQARSAMNNCISLNNPRVTSPRGLRRMASIKGARKLMTACLLLGVALVPEVGPRHSCAQEMQVGEKIDPSILEWPRFYSTNGYEFAVYQPQISQWPSNTLEGRFVVAVRPAGTSNETYGVVFFKARTEIDKVNRLVTLE